MSIRTQGPTAFTRILEAAMEGIRDGKVSLNANYELTTGSGHISAKTEDGVDVLLDEYGNTTEDTTPPETPQAKAALLDPPEHKEDPALEWGPRRIP